MCLVPTAPLNFTGKYKMRLFEKVNCRKEELL